MDSIFGGHTTIYGILAINYIQLFTFLFSAGASRPTLTVSVTAFVAPAVVGLMVLLIGLYICCWRRRKSRLSITLSSASVNHSHNSTPHGNVNYICRQNT